MHNSPLSWRGAVVFGSHRQSRTKLLSSGARLILKQPTYPPLPPFSLLIPEIRLPNCVLAVCLSITASLRMWMHPCIFCILLYNCLMILLTWYVFIEMILRVDFAFLVDLWIWSSWCIDNFSFWISSCQMLMMKVRNFAPMQKKKWSKRQLLSSTPESDIYFF